MEAAQYNHLAQVGKGSAALSLLPAKFILVRWNWCHIFAFYPLKNLFLIACFLSFTCAFKLVTCSFSGSMSFVISCLLISAMVLGPFLSGLEAKPWVDSRSSKSSSFTFGLGPSLRKKHLSYTWVLIMEISTEKWSLSRVRNLSPVLSVSYQIQAHELLSPLSHQWHWRSWGCSWVWWTVRLQAEMLKMLWVRTQILMGPSKVCSGLRWVFQIARAELEA